MCLVCQVEALDHFWLFSAMVGTKDSTKWKLEYIVEQFLFFMLKNFPEFWWGHLQNIPESFHQQLPNIS
jgi:hypothetical protein